MLSTLDFTLIIGYLVGITLLGLWVGRRSTESSEGYFLAGRGLGWVSIGLALFATNISTTQIIAAASGAYSGQIGDPGNFECLAPFCLILLGLVFAPFYFTSKVATLPEFLEKRFSPASRTILAVMAIFGALFIHIGFSLYAGAAVVNSLIPSLSIPNAIFIVSAATVIYTVFGGLKGVVVTESVQTVLLLFGSLAVLVFGLMALNDQGINSLAEVRAAARTPEQMSMIRSDGDFSWYAMLLGYPVLGIWYWCSDQTIVQRVLGARSQKDAQNGAILCGMLKLLPLFLMVIPGVFAYILFKDKIGADANAALPTMILNLLPEGLRGLVIAGLLAALMSTVAGALNSVGTLVSVDLVQRLRPQTKDQTLVRIGQWTAALGMLVAIAWSMQGGKFENIFKGINSMIAVIAPPITAVFLWGVLWKRGTAKAALATFIIGYACAGFVFFTDIPAVSGLVMGTQMIDGKEVAIQLVSGKWGIGFMMQAWWLFVICSVVFFAVSLATPAPAKEVTDKYCWDKPWSALLGPFQGALDPRLLSAILFVVTCAIYWVFR
ncbi:MAG: hypothetical protein RL095_1842 [Verrucomicrobiota bacterium]|jgi:SSS family solute:Na+ symporter